MKKFFLITVTALMATTSVKAQNGYDNTKHEVAISYGIDSNSQMLDAFENVGGIMFGGEFKNESFIGPIAAEYFYRIKNWLGVGGIVVYGHNTEDAYLRGDDDKIGEHKNTYITVMPAAKFDWFRKKNVGLYSKLALGATFRSEKIDSAHPDVKDESDSSVHFNWQASLIGIEAGIPTVRGFAELGFGEQGILVAGVRFKF